MINHQLYAICFLLLFGCSSWAQTSLSSENRWVITDRHSILWVPDSMPHSDNIEMAGKKVASIIYYGLDEQGNLSIERDLIFPQLRTFNRSNEPDWKKYRAYFRRKVNDDIAPVLSLGNKIIQPAKLDSVEIGGLITFYCKPVDGLKLTKKMYPSMENRLLVEEWQMENVGNKNLELHLSPVQYQQYERGYKGKYIFSVTTDSQEKVSLAPGQTHTAAIYYGATLNDESSADFDYQKAKKSRESFLEVCRNQLILQTPDPVLNTLFYFSKIRAAESIYESSMGLVHSPGGGNYYVGIWANDQVEYSGPFFPYLGYDIGNEAAYNTYKKFLENIPEGEGHIPYAFEVDGHFPMTHQDRGDAAMIAYGTSLYLLNSGDKNQAKELWPLIEWALEYCHKKRNQAGAVMSESDEMEGRIETGDANLSTSTLYFGGLKYAILIAKALDLHDSSALYEKRLREMEQVIENYFGATIENAETYRYFKENRLLRHWICLPLTMGIDQRKEGTLKALFDLLWTDNGILVEYDPAKKDSREVFWDRATLYALRGALKVGENEKAIEKLRHYSTTRLLGDHVPYPVEAYPENNMKHLSAESALYGRIFIEGLLGIEPAGFSAIRFSPNLPASWNELRLKKMFLFGRAYDIELLRKSDRFQLRIRSGNEIIYEGLVRPKEEVIIPF